MTDLFTDMKIMVQSIHSRILGVASYSLRSVHVQQQTLEFARSGSMYVHVVYNSIPRDHERCRLPQYSRHRYHKLDGIFNTYKIGIRRL